MRTLVPEDLYRIRSVTDVDVDPTSDAVAYVVGWADEATDSNRATIHLLHAGADRRLTFGHAEVAPRFSSDGRFLAYRSQADRDAPSQLKVLDRQGGEPRVVADFTDGVVAHAWLPDGSGLVVAAPTRPADQVGVTDDELARRPRRITSPRYRFNGRGWTHDRRVHLWLVHLDGSPPVQLTDGDCDDTNPVVSPDGRVVAFESDRHEGGALDGATLIWVVAVAGGEPRLVTEGDGIWAAPVWADDGSSLLVLGHPDRRVVDLDWAHVVDAGGGEPRSIDDNDVNRFDLVGGALSPVLVGGDVYLPAIRRGAIHIDRLDPASGALATVIGGDRQVSAFAVRSDRSIVFAAGDPLHPAELFDQRDATEGRLTDLNADLLAEIELSPPEVVEVTSADGATVQAFVHRPPAAAAVSGPRPGLVYVHGGPLYQYGFTFFDEFQLAAAAGFVVIGGNPRGSDGFGRTHAAEIVGRLGTCDWADVVALTDHLAGLPEVDESRLGIGGGSYGGFMASWAVGHTDRYRAALVERAVTNWESFQGTSDIGSFLGGLYLGATSFEDIDAVRRQSPINYVAAVDTPCLILHSDEDWRCPPEQAEQFFVALTMRGVDAELVRFPGQNHDLTRSGRPSHRVERFTIVHDFFDRHLATPAPPAPELSRPGV